MEIKFNINIDDKIVKGIKFMFKGKRSIASIAAIFCFTAIISIGAQTSSGLITFMPGDKLLSSDINHNFNYLSKGLVPVGTILSYAGPIGNDNQPPEGFLFCNGLLYDRANYPELYNVIGNYWGGEGDIFQIPDFQGRFLRGLDTTSVVDPDSSERTNLLGDNILGKKVGSYQDDQYGQHRHMENHPTENSQVIIGDFKKRSTTTRAVSRWSNGHIPYTGYTEYMGGEETRPKNAAVNFIIKY